MSPSRRVNRICGIARCAPELRSWGPPQNNPIDSPSIHPLRRRFDFSSIAGVFLRNRGLDEWAPRRRSNRLISRRALRERHKINERFGRRCIPTNFVARRLHTAVCALLAPCLSGASTPKSKRLFSAVPLTSHIQKPTSYLCIFCEVPQKVLRNRSA
jgi:hypothetical protein